MSLDHRSSSPVKVEMDSSQKRPDTESHKGPETVDYEVDWKGPDDPNKPMNWPKSRKQGIIIAVCAMRFTTYGAIRAHFKKSPRRDLELICPD